jgi:signal transduction histidine kinase
LIVQNVSEACARLVGADPGDLIGKPLLDHFAPATVYPALWDDLRRAIAGGRQSDNTITVEAATAPDQPFQIIVVPLADGGKQFGLVHFAAAPDRQRVADEAHLEQLYTAIRTIKHDINNPLTGALGNVNLLLRRDDLDEKTRRRLTVAEQEMKKIGQIVLQLASLAPPESP